MLSNERDLAWLAGFVDGEGAIGLHRHHDKRKSEGYFIYRPALQIVNTSAEAIAEVRRITGAGQVLTFPDGRKESYKPLHRYVCRHQGDLLDILTTLVPYLIVKREHAELLVEYLRGRESRTARGWYKPIIPADLAVWERLKALNTRGAPLRKEEVAA